MQDLPADDVDRWLRAESKVVSTRTLRLMQSILNRAVEHAMARDKVRRNVVGGTAVTEAVHHQQLRPVLEEGATAMAATFPLDDAGWTLGQSPTGNDEGAPPAATPLLIRVELRGLEPLTL